MAGRSQAQIAQYLGGINFPCSRDDLINHCRQQSCPSETLNVLQNLPDRQYNSMADIMSGLGEVD